MTKVVINITFGGFSISPEAVRLGRALSGNAKWGGNCLITDCEDDDEYRRSVDFDGFIPLEERDDPVLVRVVEILGEKACGHYAKLGIVDIRPGSKYRVCLGMGGVEFIEYPENIEWKTA